MGFFDLFKKSATTAEACKLFEEELTGQTLAGYPTYRTKTNFYVSPYNTLNKDVCNFDMKVENKFKMSFTYRYSKKEKRFGVTVWFYDLKITDKVEQEALKRTFPAFKIGFMPSAVTVNVYSKPCKTLDDLKKAVAEARTAWNKSGFFGLIDHEFKPYKK